jgi:hypothetical protein
MVPLVEVQNEVDDIPLVEVRSGYNDELLFPYDEVVGMVEMEGKVAPNFLVQIEDLYFVLCTYSSNA